MANGDVAEKSELERSLKELNTKVDGLTPQTTNWWAYWLNTANGLLFVILGLAILYHAGGSLGTDHVSYSFVLIVLGVALVLYGTGTQGVASISLNSVESARIRARLAGGAGAIAVVVGFGLALLHKDIKETFGIDERHIIIPVVRATADTDLSLHMFEFYREGQHLPAHYDNVGNEILVELSFSDSDLPWSQPQGEKEITVSFQGNFIRKPKPIDCNDRCSVRYEQQKSSFEGFSSSTIKIKQEDFHVQAGGSRFPRVTLAMAPKVDLVEKQDTAKPISQLSDGQRQQIDELSFQGKNKSAPANIPGVIFPSND